jgi:hypothetical protein
MVKSKNQTAGDKPKKQTNKFPLQDDQEKKRKCQWDQWAALPESVREQALLADMGLLGQDVKEYPFLNKGDNIRLTLQQQDLFRRTIGFPFSLSMLKVYLAQKCNIQSPQDYTIFDIIVALESSLQKMVVTQAGTSQEVEWNKNDPNYILASEAIVTFTENKLSLSKLSRILTPDGLIRYMRKGRRCKVHIADFRTWTQKEYPPDSVREEIADELLADRAARQKKLDAHKLL